MDHQPKMASVSSEYEQDEGSKLGAEFSSTLDDALYSFQRTAMEVDVSLEWLSAFVEECLSAKGSSLTLPPPQLSTTHLNNPSTPPNSLSQPTPSSNSWFSPFAAVPGKARSKRRRSSSRSLVGRRLQLNLLQNKDKLSSQLTYSSADPILLQQTYWLADSELLLPHKVREGGEIEKMADMDRKGTTVKKSLQMQQQQQQGAGSGRRCSHCQAQRTPQWRGGPLGPKTLCNACGVRYKKSGGLVPEYRPANSPTFVSLLHSNSHKRVMEMRMINASSFSSTAFPSSP